MCVGCRSAAKFPKRVVYLSGSFECCRVERIEFFGRRRPDRRSRRDERLWQEYVRSVAREILRSRRRKSG